MRTDNDLADVGWAVDGRVGQVSLSLLLPSVHTRTTSGLLGKSGLLAAINLPRRATEGGNSES